MKKYIIIFSLFLTLTFFSGCYTVVWDPETRLPSAETYQEEYYEDSYYADPYYGAYGYYYQYPWWLNLAPPAIPEDRTDRSENSTAERTRNREGARNNGSGDRIINTPPPATTTTTTSSGSSSSEKKDQSTDSNNSGSSGSNTSRERSTSDDANRARNNEGSRNNGGRR